MKRKTILLVDDNAVDVELVVALVRQQKIGCEVTVARDGQEALEHLSGLTAGELPAFVLLDLKMPRVDGLTVLTRLRADERLKLLPVVMFTSSNAERDRTDCYSLGCNGYVQKPVEFEQLSDAVRDVARYWLDLNQPPPGG